MQHKINWCYLCRSTLDLTHDHLPPKNLFTESPRINLITVPCCKNCNESFSKLDERFRAFVSMAVNVSETGKTVLRKKVFAGTLKKSPRLKKQMAKDLFIATSEFGENLPIISIDRDVLDGFFSRLTKGMLATFYPEIDYFDLKFSVTQLTQFAADHPKFEAVVSTLKPDERGGGAFRFWHGVAQELRTVSIWVYQFYGAASFMVTTGPKEGLPDFPKL